MIIIFIIISLLFFLNILNYKEYFYNNNINNIDYKNSFKISPNYILNQNYKFLPKAFKLH